MVHLRLNEKEANPNPYINFITVLPPSGDERARQLLRALAAQVKPVMKAHGFTVNSLEEYEWNTVFAGRNWNAGETIELVLRGADRSFLPAHYLLSTLCHELAHIKHMNHGPQFQQLWTKLRSEVSALQRRGYYGDGYWSSGQRLSDSTPSQGHSTLDDSSIPEYLCGGAQRRARPKTLKRRRRRTDHASQPGPSNHTGAQTTKKRKPGSRVTKNFGSDGKTLNEGTPGGSGTGFRKQAQSNRAREERALAAEKRLSALSQKSAIKEPPPDDDASDSGSDEEVEFAKTEGDDDRRKTLLDSVQAGDSSLDQLKNQSKLEDYAGFFYLPGNPGEDEPATAPDPQRVGSTEGTTNDEVIDLSLSTDEEGEDDHSGDVMATTSSEFRGGCDIQRTVTSTSVAGKPDRPSGGGWTCPICTLENQPRHLSCDACGSLRPTDL